MTCSTSTHVPTTSATYTKRCVQSKMLYSMPQVHGPGVMPMIFRIRIAETPTANAKSNVVASSPS